MVRRALIAAVAIACVGCGDDTSTPTGGGGTGGEGQAGATTSTTSSLGGNTNTGGAGGSGGSGVSPDIGKGCVEDGDCAGATAICLKPTDSLPNIPMTGGPAGGYCSQPCAGDAECGESGICDLVGDEGVCFRLCVTGTGDAYDTPLDPGKCWGREDVACTAVMTASGESTICLPTCGEDVQCPDGRVCDPQFRWCVDEPSDGLANGEACLLVNPRACAGVCVGVNDADGFCTDRCVYGGDQQNTHDCGGIDAGLCAATDSAAGDQNACLPGCDTQVECFDHHLVCQSVPQGGSRAYCLPPLPCPNGDTDCAQIAGTTCGTTPDGPACLDPTIPLGA